ncbi:hypothetical protein [Thermoanaerobacterium butyriciformans]|uniref:Uncharacterized protein n=1 Tax=Thermoanaerobacterium butyriciformans TaxID=1702242 RepID=A0ABS4NAS2_9THEO|nr:hypothetical protein [Thermoanaerobacterium butyriciformans]MBP2070758.1 hypothetical protein [Thermoanaerobacterium butyriciformans]
MYIVRTYLSETLPKQYSKIEEIAQDFQFLEKPTKEGFYRDIFTNDLIEVKKDKQIKIIHHMFITKINCSSLKAVYQAFQLREKPNKEGFYRDLEDNLIEIIKEEMQET